MAGRHRPRRHRDAEDRREPARRRRPHRVTTWGARHSSSAYGNGRRNRVRRSPTRCAGSVRRSTGRASVSRWTKAVRGRAPRVRDLVSRRPDLSRQAPRALGSGADDGGVRSRSQQRGEATDRCGRSAIRRATAAKASWSRPRGLKPCSATSRSRCIRTTSAIRRLIGKTLKLPLTEREIPVIADDYVEREFGTGAVKITPAHDFNDWQIGAAAQPRATRDPDAGRQDQRRTRHEKYRGLDRFAARKAVLADLEADGLLVETKKAQAAGADQPALRRRDRADADRSVVPRSHQQTCASTANPARAAAKPITEPALDCRARRRRSRFVPENWATTYNQWLENIQDWCVSRQLWWGHQIPAWYDEDGNIFVGEDEADARAHAHGRLRSVRCARTRMCSTPGSARALAVLDARLAGRNAAARRRMGPLQDSSCRRRARHRLRHHLLLGRTHGHGDAVLHRQGAVPRGLHQRDRARCGRPEDVQVEGQHDRSARSDRRHRRSTRS